MALSLRLLLVEDSEDDAHLIVREFTKSGYNVSHRRVQSADELLDALSQPWDLVVADFSMPHFSGTIALKTVRAKGLDVPFIFVSATIGEDVAVQAMKVGANDYITKGNLTRLVPAAERELREAKSRQERKGVEEQLRQAQKMEIIGRLTGGIAHDFNNFLGVIIGYSDVLLLRMQKRDPLREHAIEIKEAGLRAAALTRQLLAFSRQQVLEPRMLNLNRILRETGKLLLRLIGEDIELREALEPNIGLVRADPTQIEQVVMNLAVNARDAMPQGGALTIRTENVEVDEEGALLHSGVPLGRYVMLEVADTGLGIDQETRSRIFEPFFTTKERGKGTGLGLATCYGIVSQSGGYITVLSDAGKGATFRVYLPRAEGADEETAGSSPVGSLSGSETVLVVEDSQPLRKLACKILAEKGYCALEAANAEDALSLASQYQGHIHLLLTDVVLPGLSGPALSERLSKSRSDMKVLFLSGYTDHAVLDQAIFKSGASFLQKPFTIEALARKIREVLEGKE